MFGIDAGGTFIKFGDPQASDFRMYELPYDRAWLGLHLKGKKGPFLATGAGSRQIAEWFPELQVEQVPELTATGLGGAYLAGLDTCIVMNIGSGTPVLLVEKPAKRVTHVSGTGLGSASLAGLAYYMTGLTDHDKIEQEALAGDPDAVTLLVSDIYPNSSRLGLPGDATASNFGKFQGWRMKDRTENPKSPDLLAGLHRMVGETLAVIANLCCRTVTGDGSVTNETHPPLTAVVTGGGTLNTSLCDHLRRTFEYLKQPYRIPEKAAYGTLHGLFVYKDLL